MLTALQMPVWRAHLDDPSENVYCLIKSACLACAPCLPEIVAVVNRIWCQCQLFQHPIKA